VSLDNDDIVGILFIDLSKPFDSIHHQQLLSKVGGVGVHGAELAWFQSYLCDRMQCVCIGEAKSWCLLGVATPNILPLCNLT